MHGANSQNQTSDLVMGSTAAKRVAAVLGGLAVLAGVTSCGSSAKPAPTPPSSPAANSASASPSPDPSAKAKTDVLAAYKAFTDYKTAAFTSGRADPTRQSQVSSGDAYQSLAQDLFRAEQEGVLYKGTEVTHPQVTAVDLTASPQKATLTDCLDTSAWTAVFSATGANAAASGQPTHVFYNIAAAQATDGTWRITEYTPDRGRTC